jgi:predicted permease
MIVALLCLSVLLFFGWIPILIQFFKNWRTRSNPISLAICFVVAFSIYLCLVPFLGKAADPEVAALALQVANGVTCVFFHAANSWAKRKWSPVDIDGKGRVTDFPVAEK